MSEQAPWKHAAHVSYSNIPTLGLSAEICVRGISHWHAIRLSDKLRLGSY